MSALTSRSTSTSSRYPKFVRRSTSAGRTPNAFNNNPVDSLAGVKIYPRRWFGFGFAYRRHLNPQDQDHFDEAGAVNIPVQQITNVNVVGRGLVVVPGTSAAVAGIPSGFNFSEEPNGFIAQFWIGRRNASTVPVINTAPQRDRCHVDELDPAAVPAADQLDDLYADRQRSSANRKCDRSG